MFCCLNVVQFRHSLGESLHGHNHCIWKKTKRAKVNGPKGKRGQSLQNVCLKVCHLSWSRGSSPRQPGRGGAQTQPNCFACSPNPTFWVLEIKLMPCSLLHHSVEPQVEALPALRSSGVLVLSQAHLCLLPSPRLAAVPFTTVRWHQVRTATGSYFTLSLDNGKNNLHLRWAAERLLSHEMD